MRAQLLDANVIYFLGYHYLSENGKIYGYYTDMCYGDTRGNNEAGIYTDFLPDKGWPVLSDRRVCSRLTKN